jgi:uncharacterized protein (DUF486 family)
MVKSVASSKVIAEGSASRIELHIYYLLCHMICTTSDWLRHLKFSVDEYVHIALIPWGYVQIIFLSIHMIIVYMILPNV